jgi:hypothetical protein
MKPAYRLTSNVGPDFTLDTLVPDLAAASRAFLDWLTTTDRYARGLAIGHLLEVDDGTDDGYAGDPGTPYAYVMPSGMIFNAGPDGPRVIHYPSDIEPGDLAMEFTERAERVLDKAERLPAELAGTEVSSGTLRKLDLIEAFTAVLDEYGIDTVVHGAEEWDFNEMVTRLALRYHLDGKPSEEEFQDKLQALVSEYVTALIDQLDAIAPEGTRFGAHEGDGASFGFWPIEEED